MTAPVVLPAIWLLTLLVGLPQLSETIYTPSLPDIAHALKVTDAAIESTLTIYLFGFAVGTLFWGNLSDQIGRKVCILMGLGVYIIGCIGCFASNSFEMLMVSRFIQAFGGSTGVVIGRAICREAFEGNARAQAFSTISCALALSPAFGPLIGGLTDEFYGWSNVFIGLFIMGGALLITTKCCLPETHKPSKKAVASMKALTLHMLKSPHTIAFCLLVAGCQGIAFSYFAEGSFCLIETLGLSPALYGATFIAIAAASMTGAFLSKHLLDRLPPLLVLRKGLKLILLGATFFMGSTLLCEIVTIPTDVSIATTLLSMMVLMMGVGLVMPNALSLSLDDYVDALGTASSIFGFFYYTLVSLITVGMRVLHNGTLLPMPLYFWGIALFMWIVHQRVILPKKQHKVAC